MSAWMQMAMAVTAPVILELVRAAIFAWREHVHTRSNCRQIEAAAAARVLVLDQHGDQGTLLIVPELIVPERPEPGHDH